MTATTAGMYHVTVEDDPVTRQSPREHSNLGVLVLNCRSERALPYEGPLAEEIAGHLRDGRLGGHPSVGASPQDRVHARMNWLTAWLKTNHGATVVLPVWGYKSDDGLYMEAGDDTVFPDKCDGLLGVIYDSPAGRAETGVPPDKIAEALKAEVKIYDQWSRGELFRYVIEARVSRDGDDWLEVDSQGGYYSEEEARAEGEAAIPTTYPWFTGSGGMPIPGDHYEGMTVVAATVMAPDEDPPAEAGTEYVLLLLTPAALHYRVALVRQDGTQLISVGYDDIEQAANDYGLHSRGERS